MAVSFVFTLLLAILHGADGHRVGIVGGKEAAPNSRPYMASLQVQGRHICGGVLVKEDFVLTAAHCRIAGSYRVVLGAHSLSAREPTKQEFNAIQSIPHPDYDGHENDIMLLKLDLEANLTTAVQPISLRRRSRLGRRSSCVTAGWGDTSDNNTVADKLQEVNATVLTQRQCRRMWGDVPITRRMVCATGPRAFQGFCSGDSGGPLVCSGKSAGVVSFSGERCANPRTPDVYTRTSSYTRWIRQQLRRY